ncbi:conserved hypothetical protein [uncultured Gammaproteobacteria bacterium]
MSDSRQLPVTTDQSQSRPLTLLERPVIEQRDQIAHCLTNNLSPVHAALFAEPNLLRGAIRWYTAAPGPVVRLVDGDPEWRVAAEAHFKTLVDAIAKLAEQLRTSTRPGDQAMGELLALALHGPGLDDVFWCGDQPVIVNWGIDVVGAATGSLAHRLGGNTTAPTVRTAPAARAAAAIIAPPPPLDPPPGPPGPGPKQGPLGRWRGLWPLPLALLVLALLAWLVPLAWAEASRWLRLPGPEVCAIPPDPQEAMLGIETLNAEEAQLRRQLNELRNRLADQRKLCPRPSQAPPINNTNNPSNPNNTNNDIEDRGRRESARAGEIEVWLAWDGRADLDLKVVCPDGTDIYHGKKENCGGQLDVDMNCSGTRCRRSDHPVEHIVWAAGKAAAGTYNILVMNYSGGPSTPFTVHLKKFGVVQDFPHGRSGTKEFIPVGQFVVP